MATVDTMITNAVNRASSWGNTADFLASEAYHGVDEFDTTTNTWKRKKFQKVDKYPKAIKPPAYAALPTLPADPSPAELAAFKAGLQKMLDDFFGAYFSPADAYDAAEAWVLDALATSDPKLPGTNLDLIWGRAQDSTQALGNDLTGLELPALTHITHTTEAYDAFAHAENYARSSAKVDLWQFAAAQRIRDLRADAINATGKYIQALAQSDMVVARSQTDILNAKTALKKAAADWYMAQLGPTIRDKEREVTSVIEDRNSDMMKVDALTQRALMAADAAISAADAVSKVAQSAASSLNSIINSSTVGFA